MKKYLKLFTDTGKQWLKNQPFQQSAVITYYTLFSLPSLLVIVITVAGYFFGQSDVQNQLTAQISDFFGESTANSIENIIANVDIQDGSTLAIVISMGIIVFGATGAFYQLKLAMNKIWSVREKKSNMIMMLLNRAISLGMILVIGFMLIVSLVVTTLVTSLGQYISEYAPNLTSTVLNIFNFLFSYLFIGALFAAIFKLLPDINIRWRVTFVGASITTILFLVAEYGLSFYFGQSDPTSVYGGASSVVLIMLWIYYSCLILFFGAEFTVQYAIFKHEKITSNRFSEPAIIQELAELKEKRIHLKERKKLIRELAEEEDTED